MVSERVEHAAQGPVIVRRGSVRWQRIQWGLLAFLALLLVAIAARTAVLL